MFCPKCAAPNLENAAYCRACGHQLVNGPDATTLNGRAIAKFIIADAFVIPAVLLIALESSVQSVLWILLAVPGLLLYTWAAVDLVRSRAGTKAKNEQMRMLGASTRAELNVSTFAPAPSVTENTTNELRPVTRN